MQKSQDRLFEALDYGKKQKTKLTTKQYLVYSYLMSISKWDSQNKEDHYYVYKNSFLIKDACALLNISQPTWRSAIKKLSEYLYIYDYDKFYTIEIPNTFAPLNINLIKFLLPFGAAIKNGGNIISVYSILYKYWHYNEQNKQNCEITINQLRTIFNEKHDASTLYNYKIMLSLFETLDLISIETVQREYKGKPYNAYLIKNVKLELPSNIDKDINGPDEISDILKALEAK